MSVNSIYTDTSPLPILFNPSSILTENASGLAIIQADAGANICNNSTSNSSISQWWTQKAPTTSYGENKTFDPESIVITPGTNIPSTTSLNNNLKAQLSSLNCSWNMYPKSSKSSLQVQALNRVKGKFWCNLFGTQLQDPDVWLAGEYMSTKIGSCGVVQYGANLENQSFMYSFDNNLHGNVAINVSKLSDVNITTDKYFSPNGTTFFAAAGVVNKSTVYLPTKFYIKSAFCESDSNYTVYYFLLNIAQVSVVDSVTFTLNCAQFSPDTPNYDLNILSFHQSYIDGTVPQQVYDSVVSIWFQIFSYDLATLTLRNREFILNCNSQFDKECSDDEGYNKIGYCLKTVIGSFYYQNYPEKCKLIFSKICIENPISVTAGSDNYPKTLEDSEVFVSSPTCDYWYNKIQPSSIATVDTGNGTCKQIPWDSTPPTTNPFTDPSKCKSSQSFSLANSNFEKNYIKANCNYVYNYYACACPGAQFYDADNNPVVTPLCSSYCSSTGLCPGANGLDNEQKCDFYKRLLSNGGACSCFVGAEQTEDYYSRILQDAAFEKDFLSIVGLSPSCTQSCIDYSANCANCTHNTSLVYVPQCSETLCIIDQKVDIGDIKASKVNIANINQACGGDASDTKYSCTSGKCIIDENGTSNLSDCTKNCQALYACENGNCVVTTDPNGTSLQDCLANCENSNMKFVCNSFEQICQQDKSNLSNSTYNQCTEECTRSAKTQYFIPVILLIAVIVIMVVLIIVSHI